MKSIILKKRLCLQCEQELTILRRLRGEQFCDDVCHQQNSREAIARVKAHENIERAVRA